MQVIEIINFNYLNDLSWSIVECVTINAQQIDKFKRAKKKKIYLS